LELGTRAPIRIYFWNLPTKVTQINCILGICQQKQLKLTVFCRADRNVGIEQALRTKALCFVQRRNEEFYHQSTVFCSAAQRNFLNYEQRHCISFSRSEKL
jgi:hypothetical protein